MSNINKNEIEIINNFIQNFVDAALKTLSKSLDRDVYKTIELSMESSSEVDNYNNLKGSNLVYKMDYVHGEYQSSLAILVPEELISNISDVLTGGNGDNVFKGVLTEIEVNTALDLLDKVFKNVESVFKNSYSSDFTFGSKPELILKEMSEYTEEFDNPAYDFLINLTLKLNGEKEFPISLLQKGVALKNTIVTLRLLSDGSSRGMGIDSISMQQLSDIKIDITAELGKAKIPIKNALELVRGSIVELDTEDNSDIKVYANGVEVAMAQVVVIEDNFALRITKIISPEERMKYI